MDEYKIQTDLFDGNVKTEKNRGFRRFKNHPQQRFLPHVRVPVEYMVIISIAVLLLIIVAYAVGVEKGKNITEENFSGVNESFLDDKPGIKDMDTEIVVLDTEKTVLNATEDNAGQTEKEGSLIIDEVENEPNRVTSNADVTPLIETAYILQLASFKNENSAEEEITKLKRKGFPAALVKNRSWYQIYTEGYQTIDDAKAAQKELIEDYRDCYIKRVK